MGARNFCDQANHLLMKKVIFMAKAKRKSTSASAAQRRERVRQQRSQQLEVNQASQETRRRTQSRKIVNQRRSPWLTIGIVLVGIALVIGVFFYIANQNNSGAKPAPSSSTLLHQVTNVSPSLLAAVGNGGLLSPLQAIKGGPPALADPTGKPEFLYIGANYCPFCAAQRWPVIVALSRFGTFSKLDKTTSSATDYAPNTATFTFYQSAYTSQYIDFVTVEETTNQSNGNGGYVALQTPTADQQQLFTQYDAPPYISQSNAGSIPFIDVANKYVSIGLAPGANNQSGYSPLELANMTQEQIAANLSNQNTAPTPHILGSANYFTAAICMVTNQQPASVCKAAPIPQIEQSLNGSPAAMAGYHGGAMAISVPTGQQAMDVRRWGI
jgi:Domain of unknown function (DUF929)